MSILAPLFLLGTVLVALPIWLHRLQTQSPERKPFSSTMLLEQSRQQVHLKKKLRYLLLLAFRICLLVLLVLAFAKPVLERPADIIGGDGAVLHLVVVDTSFSMQHDGWAERARSLAAGVVDEMAEEDAAQIIAAGGTVEILGNPSGDRVDLRQKINALAPGNGHLEFGTLMANLNGLVRDYRQNVTIHLISDFQTTGLPSRFADLVPESANTHVTGLELYPVADGSAQNLYLDSITRTEQGLDVGVRGTNVEPGEVRVALYLNGAHHGETTGAISESGQTVFGFTVPAYEQGDNSIRAEVLRGDSLAGDNTRYTVIDNTPPRPVLLLTAGPGSLPVRYLTTAVETGQQGYRVEAVAVNSLDPRVISRYPWLIIDDLGIVNASLEPILAEYLRNGGAILAVAGERAQSLPMLPLAGYPVKPAMSAGANALPRSVTRIDSSHPALAETSGWRDISVSRLLEVEAGADTQTLVSLDNGAPLLLEYKSGPGRMLLLTSSLDNTWNDIPIRPVFVNFVAEAGRYLSGETLLKRNHTAGDYLKLEQSGTSAGQVVDPEGRTILSLADTHRSQDVKLNQTGIYEIYTADSEVLIAVNPDLRESDLTLMSAGEIARWEEALAGKETPAAGTETVKIEQDPVELWHILLILLGIVALVESVMGNSYLASGRGYV
jgi:hypothetical protein